MRVSKLGGRNSFGSMGEANFGTRIFQWRKSGGLGRPVIFYLAFILAQTFYFAHSHDVGFRLVFCSILPGLCLGVALAIFERSILMVKSRALTCFGSLPAGFLFFFICLISFVLLSSLLFSMPMGRMMEGFLGETHLSREFALFSVNCYIVLALVSWLGWLRSDAGPGVSLRGWR